MVLTKTAPSVGALGAAGARGKRGAAGAHVGRLEGLVHLGYQPGRATPTHLERQEVPMASSGLQFRWHQTLQSGRAPDTMATVATAF